MYRAPVAEIAHAVKNLTGLGAALEEGRMGELSEDLVDAVLEEAGKFASEEVAPLLKVGDEHGTPLADGAVETAPGFKETYRAWAEGGWNSLTAPEAFGGQALPQLLNAATFEMWHSGSVAFALCPTLTGGAIEALAAHASDELKETYLHKMVSGEWTGTMNLTEPQAGSDLNAVKATAKPAGDGTYRVFGQKIYITFGEHDMTENIVHLVLARLPDAPEGTRGISLFVVPKFSGERGWIAGRRNDVFCNGVEHKLGIHGSPTCTMIYGDGKFATGANDNDGAGGAVGYLVGEENRGLACMFTMMNNARMLVGISGVSVAEAATQKAVAYANERRQGKHPEADGMAPIVLHPDVQRNLLTMRALTDASRAIAYNNAFAIDMAEAGNMVSARGAASEAEGRDGGSYWADRAGHPHTHLQGLRDRYRRGGRLHRRAGPRRHGFRGGNRRGPASPRQPHRPDLRGHQRHPGRRPRRSQAAARRRRRRARLRERAARDRPRRPRFQQAAARARRRRARRRAGRRGSLDRLPPRPPRGKGHGRRARRRHAVPAPVRPCRRRRLPREIRDRRRPARTNAPRSRTSTPRTFCRKRHRFAAPSKAAPSRWPPLLRC